MSDDTTPSPEEAPAEEFEKPKVRRISNKNPRKTAKDKEESKSADTAGSDEPAPQIEDSSTEEGADAKPEQKRNNRRRRGKKSSKDDSEEVADEETINLSDGDSQSKGDEENFSRGQGRNPRKKRARINVDPEQVAKKAWKIYLAEVSEEGVALIADNDARELARRCFRLAELFLEEEQRKS
ncbi:MAG: hypothetical protein ACSHX9_13745 [Luteolibacter sp.]